MLASRASEQLEVFVSARSRSMKVALHLDPSLPMITPTWNTLGSRGVPLRMA